MPITRSAVFLAGLVALAPLAGCGDDPEPAEGPSVPAAFPMVLFPPEGTLVERAGGEDALQLVFLTPHEETAVADFYRERLARAPWQLVSDTRQEDATVLYADYRGRPMWVRVMAGSGGSGSRVELNGAVVATPAPGPEATPEPADTTVSQAADSAPR